jgi:hypothetical protein
MARVSFSLPLRCMPLSEGPLWQPASVAAATSQQRQEREASGRLTALRSPARTATPPPSSTCSLRRSRWLARPHPSASTRWSPDSRRPPAWVRAMRTRLYASWSDARFRDCARRECSGPEPSRKSTQRREAT